jgi:hypothetical protein
MPRKLIVAFLVAAPLGVALGFAATTFLTPRVAAGAFDIFLALIILGALGTVIAYRPTRARTASKTTTSLSAAVTV